ncbi:MAG: helix-turn-helix transcriptional regulator, partial [Hyphomicrobiales bacterium]|nr:helix-turn-helix transcriptional regulator [Hyphomicrobiales bacterium]
MHDITAKPPPLDCNLIVKLLTEALNVLDVDGIEAKRHILHARALVLEPTRTSSVGRGSLAGWQMRRVANFVHFNLSTRLRIEQVAQALKVSPGYLSRAFKATAGITYSEFVLRARIELAKR